MMRIQRKDGKRITGAISDTYYMLSRENSLPNFVTAEHFKLRHGMSYQVSDRGDAAHRSSTQTGIKLFIID